MIQDEQESELPILGVVYIIRQGQHLDSGIIGKVASSEESIKVLVKEEMALLGNDVTYIRVDFKDGKIHYTYVDWTGDIDNGVLYFDELDIV